MVQGTGLYTVALFAQRIGGFIMLPIVTRNLTPAEYGLSGVLEQTSLVLSLLLGSGFAWGVGYFYARADSDRARREVVGTTVVGAIMLGLVAMAISWPFAGAISQAIFKSSLASGYLKFVIVALPAGFFLEALFVWVRLADHPKAFLLNSLARLALTICGVLFFLQALQLHIWGMLYCSLVATVVTGISLAVLCVRTAAPLFSRPLFAQMLKFSLPLGFGAMASFVVNFGDQLILPSYVSRTELGDYVLAYKIAMLIYAFVYSPFHTYWSAQVHLIMRRDNADAIFARLFTYISAALSFCAIGVVSGAGPLMRMLPASYRGASAIIPVIVVAYCIRAMGDFVRVMFAVSGRPGLDAITSWIGSAVCLGGYFLTIPRLGIWGAAITTLVSFALITAISLAWTRRLRPYYLELDRLAKLGAATAAAFGLYALLPASSLAADAGRALLAMALFVLVALGLGFLTPREKDFARVTLGAVFSRVAGAAL
jgi:O-antigen/teichoic acid export membrane protein